MFGKTTIALFALTLQSIAAAEWPSNQLLREFQRRSIFDFFNTIRG
jgi:hypothetical protein